MDSLKLCYEPTLVYGVVTSSLLPPSLELPSEHEHKTQYLQGSSVSKSRYNTSFCNVILRVSFREIRGHRLDIRNYYLLLLSSALRILH
jgi:hypothetical protein